MPKFIDATPTWEAILPIVLTAYTDGETSETKRKAYEELRRMAQIADMYNEMGNSLKEEAS